MSASDTLLPRKICDSTALSEPRTSVRFPVREVQGAFGPFTLEGFAIRNAAGAVRAWVNVCPHRGQALDLGDGQLFSTGKGPMAGTAGLLECQAHGAYFDPDSGLCITGACPGRSLTSLEVEEREGAVWLIGAGHPG